jgi:arylformamidase
MRIIDLSQPLFDGCPNCPVHPPVKIDVIGSHAKDGPEGWHMEHLSFASHTGSHVDAPLHKLAGGRAIDGFPLEYFVGPARVADLRGIRAKASIGPEMLAGKLPGNIAGTFALLATGWGNQRAKTQRWLHDSPVLSPDGARWLIDRGARGVGIDHYSIGDAETHAILLGKPLLIIEELFFPEEVFALKVAVEFWALPINLAKHSGAPCRPVMVIR